jgi:hypothetical protein
MKRTNLEFPSHPFDYTYLTDMLQGYRYPRNKIQRLVNSRKLQRLKKGLYLQRTQQNSPIQKALLANLIYGPSYISLEYALSYWGLIPEYVDEVTSITNKRNKIFRTPLGIFSYRYLSTHKFDLAVVLVQNNGKSFLIATKEKALCDKLYFSPKMPSQKDILLHIEQNLRIDIEEIQSLHQDRLIELKDHFQHSNVSLFVDWYLKNG